MPFRLSYRLLLVFAAAGALAMGQGGARAATTAAIAVSPATATASEGADLPLDISAANIPTAPGLGGYLIVLKWDPAVLELTSIADSGWVTGGGIIVVCSAPTIDNAAGTADADCTPVVAFGAGVSTTEPHVLAQAVFHAKAPGTTAIDLTGSTLSNPSGVELISTLSGGSVTVAAPPPSATPSPIATATAKPTGTPPTASPTATPVAQATSAPASATPSTKPTEGALSKVEAPPTGSGGPAGNSDRGMAWWILPLAVLVAVLLAAGGMTAFRRAARRAGGG